MHTKGFVNAVSIKAGFIMADGEAEYVFWSLQLTCVSKYISTPQLMCLPEVTNGKEPLV